MARFRNRTVRSIDPFSSKSARKKWAVSMLTPMAAKTMANSSSLSPPPAAASSPSRSASLPSFFPFPFLTRPACRQIWAAMSLCGRPAAENRGIFWPRAIEFMTSMVEMPVWIISSGYVRSAGLMDAPLMSRNASASTGGPPSTGAPDPLKARPSMSPDTGVRSTSPVNSRDVPRVSTPDVPSKIWTTAFVPSTSSTWPRRMEPSPRRTLTISANMGR